MRNNISLLIALLLPFSMIAQGWSGGLRVRSCRIHASESPWIERACNLGADRVAVGFALGAALSMLFRAKPRLARLVFRSLRELSLDSGMLKRLRFLYKFQRFT